MEAKLADAKYGSKGTRTATDLVIGEENVGEHPYPEIYDTQLNKAVRVVVTKGYTLDHVCRKDGETYLILHKNLLE